MGTIFEELENEQTAFTFHINAGVLQSKENRNKIYYQHPLKNWSELPESCIDIIGKLREELQLEEDEIKDLLIRGEESKHYRPERFNTSEVDNSVYKNFKIAREILAGEGMSFFNRFLSLNEGDYKDIGKFQQDYNNTFILDTKDSLSTMIKKELNQKNEKIVQGYLKRLSDIRLRFIERMSEEYAITIDENDLKKREYFRPDLEGSFFSQEGIARTSSTIIHSSSQIYKKIVHSGSCAANSLSSHGIDIWRDMNKGSDSYLRSFSLSDNSISRKNKIESLNESDNSSREIVGNILGGQDLSEIESVDNNENFNDATRDHSTFNGETNTQEGENNINSINADAFNYEAPIRLQSKRGPSNDAIKYAKSHQKLISVPKCIRKNLGNLPNRPERIQSKNGPGEKEIAVAIQKEMIQAVSYGMDKKSKTQKQLKYLNEQLYKKQNKNSTEREINKQPLKRFEQNQCMIQ